MQYYTYIVAILCLHTSLSTCQLWQAFTYYTATTAQPLCTSNWLQGIINTNTEGKGQIHMHTCICC